jgi:hypothetical protein
LEVDTGKTPEDPAKKQQQLGFQELVMKQLNEGILKEWGLFAGEWCGYVIVEGSAVQLQTIVGMWIPFVKFKARELMTIKEVNKATKALPE